MEISPIDLSYWIDGLPGMGYKSNSNPMYYCLIESDGDMLKTVELSLLGNSVHLFSECMARLYEFI